MSIYGSVRPKDGSKRLLANAPKKQSKSNNWLFNFFKRNQENPNNKATTATYIQGIRDREKRVNELLNQ